MRRLRPRLSYANVMSSLAVFLVVGGGVAWALGRNDVKSRHIAPDAARASDVLESSLSGIGLGYVGAFWGNLGTAANTQQGRAPVGVEDTAGGGLILLPTDATVRDLRVHVTPAPGTGDKRRFELTVAPPDGGNSQQLSCEIEGLEQTCNSGPDEIEADAGMAIFTNAIVPSDGGTPAAAHAVVGYRVVTP
jgi:hypothetical protein